MLNRSQASGRLYIATLCATLAAFCALAVLAQSGRHVRKSTPVGVATSAPAPTPVKPVEKPKPALTFIIGMDKYGDFSRIPLYVSSGVVRACAGRLDEPESVVVEIATRDMGRADAVRRAQAEKDAYVVWLQLRPNNLSGRSDPRDNPYDVDVEYSVFAPTTGKQATSGRTFPEAYRNKRVILNPKSSGVNGDYYLNQAARGAAERILDHFHIRITNPRP